MKKFLEILITALLVTGALHPGRVAAQSDEENPFKMIGRVFDDPQTLRKVRAMGTDHFGTVNFNYRPKVYFDDESGELEVKGSGGMEIAMAMALLPTMFGALGGLEADVSIATPLFRSYFGGMGGNIGILVQPIAFSRFRASMALGAGFNAHTYLYLKPRVAVSIIPDRVDAELTWRWIPEYASHVIDSGDSDLEVAGYGEHRIRGSLFVTVQQKKGRDDFSNGTAIHVYVERVDVTGTDDMMEEHHMRPGTYWGGGVGAAF